jgi:hypothetical protein
VPMVWGRYLGGTYKDMVRAYNSSGDGLRTCVGFLSTNGIYYEELNCQLSMVSPGSDL